MKSFVITVIFAYLPFASAQDCHPESKKVTALLTKLFDQDYHFANPSKLDWRSAALNPSPTIGWTYCAKFRRINPRSGMFDYIHISAIVLCDKNQPNGFYVHSWEKDPLNDQFTPEL